MKDKIKEIELNNGRKHAKRGSFFFDKFKNLKLPEEKSKSPLKKLETKQQQQQNNMKKITLNVRNPIVSKLKADTSIALAPKSSISFLNTQPFPNKDGHRIL